jgi:hypothetical protein
MLELTDEQIQKLPTTEGMKIDGNRVSLDPETIVTGAKTGVGAVPMSQLTTPKQILQTPEISPVNVDATGAMTAGLQANTLLEQERARTEQEQKVAKTNLTASERAIRETAGLLNTEETTRNALEEDTGLNRAREEVRKIAEGISRATQSLQQFDINFMNQLEQTRVDMAKRDLTKRTFSAHSAEANLQMSIQRAGMVANVHTQQATLASLQGNIAETTEAIDKAMEAKYAPIRRDLEMEKFFYERNADLFDKTESRAANVRMAEIEKEERQISDAQERINQAVEAGYATTQDLSKMMALKTPQEQMKYANSIIAKGVAEQKAEQARAEALKEVGINWTERAKILELAGKGDPYAIASLGYDPRNSGLTPQQITQFEQKRGETQGTISMIDGMITNSRGIGAITGQIKAPAITGALQGGKLDGSFGSIIALTPVVGNIQGAVQSRNDRDKLLSDLQFLYNTTGFQEFIGLKESGLTFGALDNAERLAIFAAANRLNAALDIEATTGQINGYRGTAEDLRNDLKNVQMGLKARDDELTAKLTLSPDDMNTIMQL